MNVSQRTSINDFEDYKQKPLASPSMQSFQKYSASKLKSEYSDAALDSRNDGSGMLSIKQDLQQKIHNY